MIDFWADWKSKFFQTSFGTRKVFPLCNKERLFSTAIGLLAFDAMQL